MTDLDITLWWVLAALVVLWIMERNEKEGERK